MSRFNYNILDEFDEFVKKDINTINPRVCCLLLLPLFFMGNNKLIPLISTAYSIFLVYKLGLTDTAENKDNKEVLVSDDEEYDDEEDEEAQASDDEAQTSDEEEDSDHKRNCNEENINNNDNNCKEKDSECNCYLTILAVKNTNNKYILTHTNELIKTYNSKLIELGSIKLESTSINLIVLEIDVTEDDIEQLKQNNELYDYTIFDDTLNTLEDVKLECAWRRYKHILKENEYKDNTYTIL
jgi:hypothetical protein